MEEVRQLVQEEGREARNLVAFHVSVDTPALRTPRKPPRCASASSGSICSNSSLMTGSIGARPPRVDRDSATRLRSASAGRDKRSELQARYWALLFGNLRRAIGEIYTTVEAHENLSECKEVILVLENYTRDFKSLCEWFQLKWEYDNTPPPQRPQSLAWEVRKIDFIKPEKKSYSVRSSSSGSGKNSPCLSGRTTPCLLSGKNSPNLLTTKSTPNSTSGKVSPRIVAHSCTSPKSNSIEFFNSKISSGKIHLKTGLKDAVSKLADLKENEVVEVTVNETISNDGKNAGPSKAVVLVELGTASKELIHLPCPKPVVIQKNSERNDSEKKYLGIKKELSIQAKQTVETLNAMENDFLKGSVLNKSKEPNENKTNMSEPINFINNSLKSGEQSIGSIDRITVDEKIETKKTIKKIAKVSGNESPKETSLTFKVKKLLPTGTTISAGNHYIGKRLKISEKNNSVKDKATKPVSNLTCSKSEETICKSAEKAQQLDTPRTEITTIIKAAYSQAAAKPKIISNKILDKNHSSTNTIDIASNRTVLSRSKTIADIRQNSCRNLNNNCQVTPRRRGPNMCSYPFNLTGRSTFFSSNGSTAKTSNSRTNVKFRNGHVSSSKRNSNSINKKEVSGKTSSKITESKIIPELSLSAEPRLEHRDSFKLKTQLNENESARLIEVNELFGNSIEVLNFENDTQDTQVGGWFTVKSKRAGSRKHTKSHSHWANRFDQPSATSSLPTLNILDSPKEEQFKLKDFKTKMNEDNNNEIRKIKAIKYPFFSDRLVKDTEKLPDIKVSPLFAEFPFATEIKVEVAEIASRLSSPCENLIEMKTKHDEKFSDSENVVEFNSKVEFKPSMCEIPIDVKTAKNEKITVEEKPSEKVRKIVKSKDRSFDKKKQSMIRQRSDVTGYKTRGSRNRLHMKSLNGKTNYNVEQNRLHSSLESLCGLTSQEIENADLINFNFTEKLRTLSYNYLEDEDRLLNKSSYFEESDPLEMSEIAKMTSQIEENERKISLALDFLSEEDQRKLCEEEEQLNRQIQELQRGSDAEIEIDTETDDPETEGEISCQNCLQNEKVEEEFLPCGGQCSYIEGHLGPLSSSLEDQYDSVLAGMSWAERVDTLATLELLVARHPGRAQELHAKLSQGIRRGSLQETLKRYQTKQARAQQQRTELQSERTNRLHQLLARVEDVKTAKEHLIEEKRFRMEKRLQKATELRDQHLKDKVRKAHEEGAKLREIAFITQLQAEHRRLDHLQQWREQTDRLRQIRRDRLLRLEQKAAREAAVGERREALEAARQLKVQQVLEQRKQRDARVLQRRADTLEKQHNAALEKARGRDERLSALAAAQQAEVRALRLRIRDKQRGTEERHARNLAAIRQRATKTQTISESHETFGKVECATEPVTVNVTTLLHTQCELSKDKLKSYKKKMKKLRQKIYSSGEDFEQKFDQIPTESNKQTKIGKNLSQIAMVLQKWIATNNNQNISPAAEEIEYNNIINSTSTRGNSISSCSSDTGSKNGGKEKNCWSATLDSMERHVNEVWRIVDKFKDGTERRDASVLQVLGQVICLAAKNTNFYTQIQIKTLATICNAVQSVLVDCTENILHLLHSNLVLHLADLMFKLMGEEVPAESREQQLVEIIADIFTMIFNAVKITSAATTTGTTYSNRTEDRERAKVHKQARKGKKNPKEEINLQSKEDDTKIGFIDSRTRCNSIICYVLTGASARPAWWSCARRALLPLITAAAGVCSYSYLDPAGCTWSVGARTSLSECVLRGCGAGAATSWCESDAGAGGRTTEETQQLLACMRAVAETLPKTFQEAMGVEGGPLQFRAFAAKLLQQYAPTEDITTHDTLCDETLAADNETLLMDLITIIGYFLVNNDRHQEVLWSGPAPGVVRALALLPAHLTCRAPLAPVLRAAAVTPSARSELSNDICLEMLDEYLDSPEAEHDQLARLIKRGTWEHSI